MRSSRLLSVAVLAGMLALVTGCVQEPPPVSDKVQQYYDENVNKKVAPVPTVAAKRVVFIGDSYTSGTGAGTPTNRWTTKLAGDMGWAETNLGNGGTGYFNQGNSTNYKGVIQKAVDAKPTLVIVSGGRNDVGFGSARFAPAVADFFVSLRTALPDVKIIVTSPIYDDDAGPAIVSDLSASIRAAAEKSGATYLDIGEPLLGRPELVAADGIHPNNAGHAAIHATMKQSVTTVPGVTAG